MSDDSGEEDDGRHRRMLQGITGMPSEAFDGETFCINFSVTQHMVGVFPCCIGKWK